MMNRRTFLGQAGMVALGASSGRSMGGPVKAGQIGTRHAHASGKISAMRKLSKLYDVVGVVEPDKDRRKSLSRQKAWRDVRWMSEAELLGTPGLQVVAVETEVKDLVPTGQRCLEAGMHVHLDKPAGESMSQLRRLHATAAKRKRVVQMGYMFRYNPAFQLAYRASREGWLGRVFELDGVISKKVSAGSRKKLSAFEGGTMFELGCHLIDSMVTVLGKPDKVKPYARRTLDDGLRDNMLAVFEFPKATATIRSSVVEPHGQRRRQFVVVGTEGVAEIRPLEPPKMELVLEKGRGDYAAGVNVPDLPKMTGRYDDEFRDLAKVVRGEKKLDWNAEHDLAVHEAILLASGLPLDK